MRKTNTPIDTTAILLIEYKTRSSDIDKNMDRREEILDFVGKLLVTAGLGIGDGGSGAHEIITVCCLVHDFNAAKSFLTQELKGTGYDDYIRIIEEDKEYWREQILMLLGKDSPVYQDYLKSLSEG